MNVDDVMTANRLMMPRYLLISVGVPVAASLIGLVAQLALLPTAPDPIAIHWGGSGGPDGYAPGWMSPLFGVLFGLVLPLILVATTVPGLRAGEGGSMSRMLCAMAAFLSVFLNGIFVGSLLGQQGLADAGDAPSPLVPLVVSFALGGLIALLTWSVLPPLASTAARAQGVAALDLVDGEQVTWLRTAALSNGAIVIIAFALAISIAATVLTWVLTGAGAASWVATGATLLIIVLMALTMHFHVRVDARGVEAKSAFGVLRITAPIDEIASVGVIEVSPMSDFGGWGLRTARGRTGIVTRRGEALEVIRRDGRRLTITVDDAASAAAVLQAALIRRT